MFFHHFLKLIEIDATISVLVNIANELLPDFIWHDVGAGALFAKCGLQLTLVNIVIVAGIEGFEGLLQVVFTNGRT